MRRLLACAALACFMGGCSTTFDLGSNDAGVPYDADCKPGTYIGQYSCMATMGDSSFAAFGSGTMKIALVPAGPHTLALAPDASLSPSSTSNGTMGIDPLTEGVLDCPTRQLKGKTGNVMLSGGGFNTTVSGTGTFDAVYNADASPPELDNGTLNPSPILATTCTWSAKLE